MEKPFFGGLVSIGRDIASLETLKPLKILDNIQMDAGGKLMCKVVEKKENDIYILHYTSIPSGFESWIHERSKQ